MLSLRIPYQLLAVALLNSNVLSVQKDISPLEMCSDLGFYCVIKDSQFHLRHNHPYYHQVQLQLFVGMDLSITGVIFVSTPQKE